MAGEHELLIDTIERLKTKNYDKLVEAYGDANLLVQTLKFSKDLFLSLWMRKAMENIVRGDGPDGNKKAICDSLVNNIVETSWLTPHLDKMLASDDKYTVLSAFSCILIDCKDEAEMLAKIDKITPIVRDSNRKSLPKLMKKLLESYPKNVRRWNEQ